MKKGFIFSLDSFLALTIFTLVVAMIYLFFIFSSPTTQQYYFSEDTLVVLNNVKINELDLAQYPKIEEMINNGKISDTSSTLVEQIAEFQINEDKASACLLFRDATKNLLPSSYNSTFQIRNDNICDDDTNEFINIISRSRTATARKIA